MFWKENKSDSEAHTDEQANKQTNQPNLYTLSVHECTKAIYHPQQYRVT